MCLDQLHPQLALISVGKEKNRYQHPHKELLDRLKERSGCIFVPLEGAIRLIGWDHWKLETVR